MKTSDDETVPLNLCVDLLMKNNWPSCRTPLLWIPGTGYIKDRDKDAFRRKVEIAVREWMRLEDDQ